MKRHFFVCTNRRSHDGPKPSCAANGADAVLFELREERERRGLSADVHITASGCLGPCPGSGVVMVVYPEGVWYSGVTTDDVREIVEKHLVDGEPVERLRDRTLD